MRVAVLGAGNGGVASAFDFAQHGHEVALFAPPDYAENVVAIDAAGGITAHGDLEGFAPVRYSGSEAGAALEGAKLVILVGLFVGQESGAEICVRLRFLVPNTNVLLISGAGPPVSVP